MPKRHYLFKDTNDAQSFLDHVGSLHSAASGGRGGRRIPALFTPSIAGMNSLASYHGGTPYYHSSDRREQSTYDYKPIVHQMDREYLEHRDPTARTIIRRIPRDVWRRCPRTFDPAFLAWQRTLTATGFLSAARAAHRWARRDGCGAIVVEAGGKPDSPLRRSLTLGRFRGVPKTAIMPLPNTVLAPGNVAPAGSPAFQIMVKGQGGFAVPQVIHPDRVFFLTEDDDEEEDPFALTSVMDVLHDKLWDWRDILITHRNAAIQGNPIGVAVDTDNEFTTKVPDAKVGTADDPLTVFDEEVRSFEGWGKDSFSPTEGAKPYRVGPADLEVPEIVIRSIVGAIASGSDMPTNVIFPPSRGSEQMGAEERAQLAQTVHTFADIVAAPVYQWSLDVAAALGFMRRSDAVFPTDVEWHDPLYYNERERAYIFNTRATATSTLVNVQRAPPRFIDELFPLTEASSGNKRRGSASTSVSDDEGGDEDDEDVAPSFLPLPVQSPEDEDEAWRREERRSRGGRP